MKKAILLLPLVLSLTSCWHTVGIKVSHLPSIEYVSDGGIYDYEDDEGKTIDLLFYFQYVANVDSSYFPESKNDNRGVVLYVIDNKVYEEGYNYSIIKCMTRSEYISYYEQSLKDENFKYCRTILFKIPTSFFKNESGIFLVNQCAYHILAGPENFINRWDGIKLHYQKLMNNTKIEIWKNKSQY